MSKCICGFLTNGIERKIRLMKLFKKIMDVVFHLIAEKMSLSDSSCHASSLSQWVTRLPNNANLFSLSRNLYLNLPDTIKGIFVEKEMQKYWNVIRNWQFL